MPDRSSEPLKSLWIGTRRSIDVPCTAEIEQTSDILFANVALQGVDVKHGDALIVHEAPSHIAFGEHSITQSTATVIKANWLDRAWTRLASYFELTELYEVGFQPAQHMAVSLPSYGRQAKRSDQ